MAQRVLLVDDSELVRGMYGERLREAGYEVLLADDGMKAINLAFEESPDLILLDVQMPKVNGYQVCRLLKDHPMTKAIPIVMMTAREAAGMIHDPRKWSFQTGANGYYGKDEGTDLINYIKPFLDSFANLKEPKRKQAPVLMSEQDILIALSQLLDRQLYLDITRLKELDEKKDAFVANVAHEFGTPIMIMKGFLENIKDGICGPTTPEQAEAVTTMLRTANRIGRLVRDLLELSKIEAGMLRLKKEKVDMNDILRNTAEYYAVETNRKKLTVEVEMPSETIYAAGDEDRLTQVVVNLLSNAIKYTPEGAKITLRLSKENGKVRVEVRDTGPGIPETYRTKIFDKFERIYEEKAEGTGLGLPIARDIVVLHGGEIWIESQLGKGSSFIFWVPEAQ